MAGFPEVGDTERLMISIRDVAGAPVDPVTLTLTIEAPSGTRTVDLPGDPDIAHDGVGEYHRDVPLTEAGTWAYEWETTDPDQVQGGRITVRRAPLDAIPRSLSLEELKLRLDHQMDLKDDVLMDDLVAAFMQAQAPPPFGTGRLLAPDPGRDVDDPVSRTVVVSRRRVQVPDARVIESVTVDGVTQTFGSWENLSKDGYVVQITLPSSDGGWLRPGLELPLNRRTVVVTGRFGFSMIPDDLAGAIYVLAARWHYERQAQYADNVEILEGTAVQAYFRQLPPRVKLVFAKYAVGAVGGLQ